MMRLVHFVNAYPSSSGNRDHSFDQKYPLALRVNTILEIEFEGMRIYSHIERKDQKHVKSELARCDNIRSCTG